MITENELSTCQRIKVLSCHILTRSHTHSSPQCLNLMSQVSLNGSCTHQHYHTAIISLCNRQFIILYSSASISICCCHDRNPSYCHVTCSLTFSISKTCTATACGTDGWFLNTATLSRKSEYTRVDG